ncbi:MAG: NMD3-related protein [Candidatus Woesearchaeota archaeon]|nr:NMD3-related protein [Candidatus Woesearchaeota archaeon]
MRPHFCPRCGKKDIEGELCAACAHRENPLEPLETRLDICVHCRRYKRKNTWLAFKGFREIIREAVGKGMAKQKKQETGKVIIPEHELERLKEAYASPKPGLEIEIQVGIQRKGEEMPHLTPLAIFLTICNHCGKSGTQYFEGILQIRKAPEDVYAYIRKKLDLEKGKGAQATTELRVQNGMDFYITKQAFLKKIGVLLHKKFGGVLKSSVRIFTLDKFTSKDVYRLNIYFEPMPLKEGDAFLLDGVLMKLLRRGKQIVYFDFEKNTSTSTKSGTLMKAEKVEPLLATVIKNKPFGEVMDPETYQPMRISNVRLGPLPIGKKVNVVHHKGKMWVV